MITREDHIILGIHVTDRVKHVSEVQSLLTGYGCHIKIRLGLHEASPDYCSPNGLIILEMLPDEIKAAELVTKLNAIEGVETKKLTFTH